MRRLTIAMLSTVLPIALATHAQALQIRSGENVLIEQGVTIDDDVFAMGQQVDVKGDITGNLIAMAQRVTVEGKVAGSMVACAQTVDVTGPVGGSLHAAGETVNIRAAVERNLAAAGAQVTLGEPAVVKRDAFLAAQLVDASGAISGQLRAAANTATLNAGVGGTAKLWVETLRLTDKARVGSDLVYVSPKVASIAPGAIVTGRTVHQLPEPVVRPNRMRAIVWFLRLFRFVWLLLFTAVLVAVLPRHMYDAAQEIRKTPLWALLTGFLVIVVTPIVVILLVVPLLPASLLLAAIWLALLYVGQVAVGVFLGSWVFRLSARREVVRPLLAGLVGVVIISFVSLIPVLGFFVRVAVALFGVGALGLMIGRTIAASHRRPLAQAPAAPGAT